MDQGPSSAGCPVKKEEEEDFTFNDPGIRRKCGGSQHLPSALSSPVAKSLRNELNMNWDLIEVIY